MSLYSWNTSSKMALKRPSYFLEMVSLVANQMVCFRDRAYWKQEWAKLRMDLSRLCWASTTPGPLNSWTTTSSCWPLTPSKTSFAVPGSLATISTSRYTSP